MDIERLVKMANDIAHFFQSEPDHEEAVKGILGHLTRFWDPRMRKALSGHVEGGGKGLMPLALEAAKRLPPVRQAS
ncbi:MAG: formate dehydrogenase subunit delta [Burkholderiales bacterium]|nr:formate dehydrogenase subunit delta [Burkholderiales bacterium]